MKLDSGQRLAAGTGIMLLIAIAVFIIYSIIKAS